MKEVKSRTGEVEMQPREYVPAGPVRPKRPTPKPPALPPPATITCPHCNGTFVLASEVIP